MNKKILLLISALVIVALPACGPDAPPTLSSAEIEGTAVALAWTSLAQTQAAQPTLTPTPIPPTATPFPTVTPFPTLAPLQPTAALAAVTPTLHPCNDIPPAEPAGSLAQVKFINNSGGQVNLSFGMNDQNSLGECGTYSYSLSRYDQPIVTVLAGCYWSWGWITYPDASTSVAKNVGLICLDTSKINVIGIGTETIGFN